MTEILLSTINAKWIHPSLALRLLKAGLGDLENRASILEFNLRQNPDERKAALLAARPRILGLSISIWNHRATLETLAALEGAWQEKPAVVLGGPELFGLDEKAEIFRYADHIIRGEGETAFRELCHTLLNGGRAPRFIRGQRAETVLPAYRLYTAEDLERKLTYVEASRGCPFGCEFCQSSAEGNGVREFPLEPFLAEMDTLVNRGARTFKFLDRSFNLNAGRARRIMEFFLRRLEKGAAFTVHFEMVPGLVTPELRETLSRFPPGSLRLELGIQTLNPGVAALVKRPGNPEADLEILSSLRRETAAIIHADLIAGLPGEDLAGFGSGFDRLRKALSPGRAPAEIQPGILKLLPGTAMARHREPFGMKFSPEPPYEILESAALPEKDMKKLKNFARFWELIMNRNTVPGLFPAGEPVFWPFMELSGKLLARFGRNWGIDRRDLVNAVSDCLSAGLPEGGPVSIPLAAHTAG